MCKCADIILAPMLFIVGSLFGRALATVRLSSLQLPVPVGVLHVGDLQTACVAYPRGFNSITVLKASSDGKHFISNTGVHAYQLQCCTSVVKAALDSKVYWVSLGDTFLLLTEK